MSQHFGPKEGRMRLISVESPLERPFSGCGIYCSLLFGNKLGLAFAVALVWLRPEIVYASLDRRLAVVERANRRTEVTKCAFEDAGTSIQPPFRE